MSLRKFPRLLWIAALVATAVVVAGCGSSSGGSHHPGGGAATGAAGEQVAAAVAVTKKYTDAPGAFPVSTALPKALPPGTTFGWLQCVSTVCAQLTGLFDSATKALGGRLVTVKAGASAQDVQSAFNSLLEQKPAAIFLPSVQPESVSAQIQQAKAAGIPTVSTGIMDPQASGISAGTFGEELAKLAGKLLADWVITKSTTSRVVFYTTHELDFLAPEESAFRAELSSACGGCKSRTVNVPIAAYSSTAPQLVVSDLESHPDTTLAIFGAAAGASGLVAALKVAGITTPFIGFSLTPENLQNIQSGGQEAGLGLDYPVLAWTMADEAARLILQAPLSDLEKRQIVPVQWLTSDNLHGDMSKGWTGYPDYTSRFAKLWNAR
jgi:ribose transport system substrate-binding protein